MYAFGSSCDDDVAQLLGLARTKVGRGIRSVATLDQSIEDERSRGLGEERELRKAAIGIANSATRPDSGEHNTLEPHLPVLNLGDILEFGPQAGNAPKCVSIC
jgi:hypothetical protein